MEVGMAAKALAPFAAIQTGFWDRFQQVAMERVRECNAIAGEVLWVAEGSSSPTAPFTVRSVEHSDNSVACSFDTARAKLTCRPGPAIAANPLVFYAVDGTLGTFRCGTTRFTLEEALGRILDELMWTEPPDPCDCQEEETARG
jgi:hypothetical protein